MFENITQLENEVKEFHKNILASQDLLKRLDSLILAITEEHNSVVAEAEAVNQTILEKSQSAALLLETSTEKMHQANSALQTEFGTHAAKICKTFEEQSEAMTAAIAQATNTVTFSNQTTLDQIQTQHDALSEKADYTLNAMTDSNAKVVSDMRVCISGLQSALTAAADQRLASNGQMLQDTIQQLNQIFSDLLRDLAQQDKSMIQNASTDIFNRLNEYSLKLQESVRILEQSRYDLQKKYDEFSRALASDKLKNILEKIDNVEKSMNSKFTLMFTGLGITAILAILSIFF